jgi:hypothetical protein
MVLLRTFYRLTLSLGLASCLASASFINGGFESGDLTGWSSLGTVSASMGATYSETDSVSPDSGDYAAHLITQNIEAATIAAQMSIDVDTLNASNEGVSATVGSLIWQSVFASAGDVLQFRWNFVEADYLPYDDWAFYGVQYESDATELTRFASLASVGPDEGLTVNGWTTLTVTIPETGNYTFYFGVVNATDTSMDSELWIDGAYAGSSPPAPVESEVPEPATLALLIPVLAAIVIRSRRSKV